MWFRPTMGSIETPTSAENGSAAHVTAVVNGDQKPPVVDGRASPSAMEITPEPDVLKKRKASVLPLEVGTRVMCRWRDGKYHPVKVIERRKLNCSSVNDYEYYVHYTECKGFSYFPLCLPNFSSLGLGFLYCCCTFFMLLAF